MNSYEPYLNKILYNRSVKNGHKGLKTGANDVRKTVEIECELLSNTQPLRDVESNRARDIRVDNAIVPSDLPDVHLPPLLFLDSINNSMLDQSIVHSKLDVIRSHSLIR